MSRWVVHMAFNEALIDICIYLLPEYKTKKKNIAGRLSVRAFMLKFNFFYLVLHWPILKPNKSNEQKKNKHSHSLLRFNLKLNRQPVGLLTTTLSRLNAAEIYLKLKKNRHESFSSSSSLNTTAHRSKASKEQLGDWMSAKPKRLPNFVQTHTGKF